MSSTSTQFKQGNPGRPHGSVNKFHSAIRGAFERVFNELQVDTPNTERGEAEFRLKEWAKKHPAEFYAMCARLVPKEISGPGGGAIPIAAETKLIFYMPENGRRKVHTQVQAEGKNGSKRRARNG